MDYERFLQLVFQKGFLLTLIDFLIKHGTMWIVGPLKRNNWNIGYEWKWLIMSLVSKGITAVFWVSSFNWFLLKVGSVKKPWLNLFNLLSIQFRNAYKYLKNSKYRVSHIEVWKVIQLWWVKGSIISLNYDS